MPMTRVVVIGSPGSGKSRLAGRLASALELPIVRLDDCYWGPGWSRPAPEAWAERVTQLAAADGWVIEGHYADTLEARVARAHAAVLFDIHPIVCALRILRRTAALKLTRRARRAALPAAVRDGGRAPVAADLAPLLWKALTFRRRQLRPTTALLQQYSVPVVTIRSRRWRPTAAHTREVASKITSEYSLAGRTYR